MMPEANPVQIPEGAPDRDEPEPADLTISGEFVWVPCRCDGGIGLACQLGDRQAVLILPVAKGPERIGYSLHVGPRIESIFHGVTLERARRQAEPIVRARYPMWFAEK